MPTTVAVTGATNATPIEVTTGTAHGLASGQVVKIKDVAGNTNANGTWIATVTSSTKFTIAYASQGSRSGNATYTSGGTVTGPLGSVNAIVGLISGELVALLVARGLPALTDGEILLGSDKIYQNSFAPRVIFVPDTSDFGPGGFQRQGGTANAATVRTSAERRAQESRRALMEESLHFRIHVWGQNDPPDLDLDYDATRDLYHALIKVIHDTSVATFTLTKGTWAANDPKSGAQVVAAGREIILGATWRMPVVDNAFGYTTGISAAHTNKMQTVDGTPPTVGCTNV